MERHVFHGLIPSFIPNPKKQPRTKPRKKEATAIGKRDRTRNKSESRVCFTLFLQGSERDKDFIVGFC